LELAEVLVDVVDVGEGDAVLVQAEDSVVHHLESALPAAAEVSERVAAGRVGAADEAQAGSGAEGGEGHGAIGAVDGVLDAGVLQEGREGPEAEGGEAGGGGLDVGQARVHAEHAEQLHGGAVAGAGAVGVARSLGVLG